MKILVIQVILAQICAGKLLPCAEIMHKVCFKSREYFLENNPEPFATKIDLTLKIFDVGEVDEIKQSVTLSMMTNVQWQDFRLDVNKSKDDIEK